MSPHSHSAKCSSLTRSTVVPGDQVIVNDQDRLARHPNR